MHDLPGASASRAARVAVVAPAGALVASGIALAAFARRLYEGGAPGATPALAVMVPFTSAAILLAAASLLLLHRRRSVAARRLGRLAAAVVALLGVLTVAQCVADWETGSARGTFVTLHGWWAQRPSPATGLGLVLIGSALFAAYGSTARAKVFAGMSAAATLAVALAALVGHAYGASPLYGLNEWGGTGVSTAVAMFALASGLVFADTSGGFASLAVSGSAGGQLIRRLIPVALLAPLLFGWLAVRTQNAGLVDAPFGTALLTVALSVLLVGFIVRQAAVLHAVSLEREKLTAQERASREQVTNILESITDAFFALDRAWRFTYANREAERILQRPREKLLGRVVWEEFPEAASGSFRREYERALAEQTTVDFEAYYPPLASWFEVHAFPSADGLSVYFRDISARKRAEDSLRDSEERYRLLADMIPQHIWATESSGYHTYFSRRWFEFTGATQEQTEGDGWLDLLHPDDRERTIACWQHSLETGEPYAIEYRFRGADGTYRWFLGQAMPQRNAAGRVIKWFGTLTDISERKRLEQSRASLMRGFSHDVKNPLNAALVSAQLLERGQGQEGALSEKQRSTLARIRRSIRAAVRLIDDLLELARAEAGQLEIECADTNVGQVVREVVEEFRAQAQAAGIELDIHAPEVLAATTDPVRLRQVVANLLSNAVKYAAPGPVSVSAEIPHGKVGWIAVHVADTGPGIPAEKQEAIFEEYTRLDPKASHGAGIGLAISRRIARLLGGDLTVASEPGHGSTFTMLLPARCADALQHETPDALVVQPRASDATHVH